MDGSFGSHPYSKKFIKRGIREGRFAFSLAAFKRCFLRIEGFGEKWVCSIFDAQAWKVSISMQTQGGQLLCACGWVVEWNILCFCKRVCLAISAGVKHIPRVVIRDERLATSIYLPIF